MRVFRAVAGCMLVAGLLTTSTLAPSGATAQQTVTPLPIASFNRIVTDPGTGRVFVSSYKANAVVATDAGARVLATVPDMDGAAGMLVVGGTLYVALAKDHAIVGVDTTTLTERVRYPTGEGTCPGSLAAAGTDIWFSYGCNDQWGVGLGVLRLGQGEPAVLLDQQDGVRFLFSPTLVSTGRADGPLAVGELGGSPSSAHVFDVAAGAARLRVTAPHGGVGYNLKQLALTPDGSRLLIAAGNPYHIQVLSTADFTAAGNYPLDSDYPAAVAITPDGRLVAGAADGYYGRDVFVYRAGSTTPVFAVDFGQQGGWQSPNFVADRGLAWSSDGRRLYVVTVNAEDRLPTLRVLNPIP